MDEEIVLQILDELLSFLEPLDTQSSALVQFLKAKGVATDEELAPFLEQAGNASSVRWRGARVRIGGLIASAMRNAEQNPETQTPMVEEQNSEAAAKASKEKETDHEDSSEPAARSAQASEDNPKSDEAAAAMPEKEQKESGTSQPRAVQENAKREAA